MKVLAVASQKGGVGKTATTVNLAAGLALMNLRVLVVDLDPQAQASKALGIQLEGANIQKSLALALQGAVQGVPTDLRGYVIDRSEILTKYEAEGTLMLLASEDATMTNAQHLLHTAGPDKATLLQTLLSQLSDDFDFAVIDTPPSVGALPAQALAASDYAIALCSHEYQTLEGAVTVKATLRYVQQRTMGASNPRYLGAVLNKCNPPSKWKRQEIDVRNGMVEAGLLPLVSEIRADDRISGSYASAAPAVIQFGNNEPGKRYAALLQELFDRMEAPEEEWEIAETGDAQLDALEARKEKVESRV